LAGFCRDSRDGPSYALRHAVDARDLHHHRGHDLPGVKGSQVQILSSRRHRRAVLFDGEPPVGVSTFENVEVGDLEAGLGTILFW
jgi:hypothetical protein